VSPNIGRSYTEIGGAVRAVNSRPGLRSDEASSLASDSVGIGKYLDLH